MRPNIPPDQFAEWLRQLPKEVVVEGNRREFEQTKADWIYFKASFKVGTCSICEKPMKTFSADIPCLHWLLRPKRFNKKHFPLIYEKYSYFRIAAYVRWVAAIEGPMKNINDLKDEHPADKLFDFTAKYKHITWSFSCGKSDLAGHQNSKAGKFPHYHFQMRLGDKPFINYSEFHIPFHADDLYDMELFSKHGDIARHGHGPGMGMSTFLSSGDGLESVIENSIPTENYDDAAYELSTIVMAPEGTTMSGEDIYAAINEAKASGKTIASVMRKKLSNATITTIVSPGKGVPEAKPRTPRTR